MRGVLTVGSWLGLVVLVWLGYFVVEVSRRLDVWPF